MKENVQIFEKEYVTVADEIFSEEDMLKYKAGDEELKKFYDMINEMFPSKHIIIGS